jgi:hypothetical protein
MKEHVSQMNAMQNRLIAMERGQASRNLELLAGAPPGFSLWLLR